MDTSDQDRDPGPHALPADRLRKRCDPAQFGFETTAELEHCPINIIGQPRAQEALRLGLATRGPGYNIFVSGHVGCGRSTVVRRMLDENVGDEGPQADLVFVHNFRDPDQPRRLTLATGQGPRLRQEMERLVEGLHRDLSLLFDSEPHRSRRARRIEAASLDQKARFKEFDARIKGRGFSLSQVPVGPYIRSQLMPVVDGKPIDIDELEKSVDAGEFDRAEFEKLQRRLSKLRHELDALGREVRRLARQLQGELQAMNRELAQPLVEESVAEVRSKVPDPQLDPYLEQVVEDVLDHLEEFVEADEGPDASGEASAGDDEAPSEQQRYAVNVVVDNSGAPGRPVIWETTPSHRNLFGTIGKRRTASGEWDSDHTRIKAGSLLRASGGFLMLDALDVMVEPGVWPALKRTLRHGKVEIQSFDPAFVTGVTIKPEPVPVDVKILLIGTPHIYRLLRGMDEDFRKIFKIKAEFAIRTALNEEEVFNYACLVHKRINDEGLLPFHREAVAGIVEYGIRLAGHHNWLTTRFSDITDVVREAAYWAGRASADHVGVEHVDQALRHRTYRVDLVEETLRERIAAGEVLLDLAGRKIGQVNGLAVLSLGDHEFGQPSRITATTATGRGGIIDIEREAEMSGAIHTKGVLIFTGILRARFAQGRPLALTASICFEQSYGSIDGDSASCAELYALLSSLADVPIRQGIAVTGSVNQKGEVQPIGGVNQKIEGYFDLCRLVGLNGEQGVLIPRRNVPHLMLRKDLVAEVEQGRFHVWGVETIEEGLEVLTGLSAGARQDGGPYPPTSVFGRADLRLARLAEDVRPYGPPGGVPGS